MHYAEFFKPFFHSIVMREFSVKSQQREQMIDITEMVQKAITHSGVSRGIAVVYVPHTTAGITINEGADPDVQRDIITTLARHIPKDGNFYHIEGNSDAHIKSSLLGCSQTVIITDGRVLLGTWQRIFFVECDGPRTRRVFVEIIGTD